MADYVQVSTAADTREAATELLNSAVQARLAAGGQVLGPVMTAFWHLGEFGNGEEWIVVLKTTADRYPELEAHLIEAHPWDNPEVSFTPLGGSAGHHPRPPARPDGPGDGGLGGSPAGRSPVRQLSVWSR